MSLVFMKDFTIDKMRKAELKGYVHDFSIAYNIIDTNDILDIHKYLMKKSIIMFEFIKNCLLDY